MARLQNTSLGDRACVYNQTVKNMSAPMKEVEARTLARSLWHNGSAVLTWMMGNASFRPDAKENVYPRKENESDPYCKIDGVVALIMAMGLALNDREEYAVGRLVAL
jgi:phage terminase large subunit-like protein